MAKKFKLGKGAKNKRLLFLLLVLLAVVIYAVYYFMYSASYSADSVSPSATCPKYKTCVKYTATKKINSSSGSYKVQLYDIKTGEPLKKEAQMNLKTTRKDCGSFGTPGHGKNGGCTSGSTNQTVKTDSNGTFTRNFDLYEITQENFKNNGKTWTSKFYTISAAGSSPAKESNVSTFGFWIWQKDLYSLTGYTPIGKNDTKKVSFTKTAYQTAPFTSKTNLDSATKLFNKLNGKTLSFKIKADQLP